MASSTNETRVPLGEIARILEDSVPDADAQRAAGLDQLAQVRAAKAVQLKRERERFSALAEASDPFLAKLDARDQTNQGLILDLALAANQARTPVPPADANTWVLHGRVLTAGLQPAPNLLVVVVDQKASPVAEAGHANTDATGYFLLRIAGLKPASGIISTPTAGGSATVAAPAPDTAQRATTGGVPPSVFLQVLDSARTKKPLLTDTEALTPRPGRTDYRELVLP
jgi:hypothetical protein